jgi:putative oxidoreductase
MLDVSSFIGEVTMSDMVDSRLYFPMLGGLSRSLEPFGYPLIRFSVGAILIPHGWGKLFGTFAPFVAERVLAPMGFPAPYAWVYFLGVLETVGVLALAVGLFTRPIAVMLAVEMLIITFGVHLKFGYGFASPGGGYEYPLLLLMLCIGIFMRGSGGYSLDRLIGREI